MEDKTKLLIAIGASFTANCQPCLKTAIIEAQKAGKVKEEEIREAIAIGRIVRKGAVGKMDKFASTLTGKEVGSSDECPFGSTEEEVKEWIEQDDQCECADN